MKKPVVDYTQFKFSKITTPQYRHLLLLLGWVIYFIMYFVTENLITESRCNIVHSIVDDMIPFNEYFVIAYVSWYVLLAWSIFYFLLYDIESFKWLQIFVIAAQVIGMATYIIWPSVQYLRPEVYPRDNLCTALVRLIQTADTPTGVCPSEHVGFSLGILSAWYRKRDAKLSTKIIVSILVIFICLSVLFIKQHSFTDVWAAGIMGIVIEIAMRIVARCKNGKKKMG